MTIPGGWTFGDCDACCTTTETSECVACDDDSGGGGGGTGTGLCCFGYEGADALRAVETHSQDQIAYLLWAVSESGGGAGMFSFVENSVEPDDGINVIVPNDGGGAWIRRSG